ncbi:hypothetical protein MTO96_022908, partial [Rhipicephalus appendiculatus]
MSMFKAKMLSDTSEDDTDNDHDAPKKAPSFRATQVPKKPAAYSMPKLETGKSKKAPHSSEDSESADSDDSDEGNVTNTWSQSGSHKAPVAANKKRKNFAQGGSESKHMRLSSSFSNDDDEPAEGGSGNKRKKFAQGGHEGKFMKYSTSLSNDDDEPAESGSGLSMGNYSNISQKLM